MKLKNLRPKCVFTEQELQEIVPSFKIEMLKSEKESVKLALTKLFKNLGADFKDGYEIVTEGMYRNKFNKIDTSPRIVLYERVDSKWRNSKFASDWAKLYTEDASLLVTIGKLRTGGGV